MHKKSKNTPFKKNSTEKTENKRKILIVEDNLVNLKLLKKILEKLECKVDSALNGLEAIEKIKNNNYDLVFMDLQMPVMGGIETVTIIRKKINRQVPIIALSAAAREEDKSEALTAGMNDFLTKPLNLDQLKEKLLKW